MHVLLIGQDPADAGAVREALAGAQDDSFTVECVTRLSEGLDRLSRSGIAAVLLDLNLPDSQGLASFEQVWRAAPHVPILVIGSPDDQEIAGAVRRGAQDYLQKARLASSSLPQALRHIIERKAADEAQFLEQQRAEATLNSIGDAVLSTDVPGNVTYLNRVAERMTGWPRRGGIGPAARGGVPDPRRDDPRTGAESDGPGDQLDRTIDLAPTCLLIRRDGFETAIENSASPIHDRSGQVIGAVIVFNDVSEVRAMSLRAVYLAQHDFLTDLPNRMLLSDRLTQAIALARRHGHRLAVLFLDLDRFKHVNDSLGHVIGDGLLQSVARRLVRCVRSSDTVSRLGGDEFVLVLSEIQHADDAAASAQKIIAALVAPHEIANHQLHVTATIGISIYPDDGPDAEKLIKAADTAMYHAKESGRNSYQFFEAEMNARAVERQWIEAGLHRALARGEFVLHYQPKINLETGAMTGAEALIRWAHPERGLIYPTAVRADRRRLRPDRADWPVGAARSLPAGPGLDRRGRPPMAVAVNISAGEFRDPRFLEHVRGALHDNRLEARCLELELTESSLIQHAESTALVLQALKDLGVQVAIDDFGTGYSSLSYLRQVSRSTR